MSESLESSLRQLAQDLHVEVPADLEAAVLARVAREPTRSRPRRTARWIAGLFLTILGVGAVASPVGASILEWFGFHGVTVVEDQAPATEEPTVPAELDGLSLQQAATLAGFPPLVPAVLGAPDGVTVSADRRLVSLSWGSGADTVRLDQFRGTIDPMFQKMVDVATFVSIRAGDALWLPTPHYVSVVADDGTTHRLPPRSAAPTLVWSQGSLTLRLEGDHSLERATEIADSTG
ncbi:MAG: hypothetical protein JWN68_2426 [Nocardioides sp.]|jgi:hypothetical protein|uniref:hypothetical protein n=1 Tax=Nocardioides sp. TaxID=35761 RepID=UPI00260AE880|nr:hypothetical protein [Nocardioides sp.]MCW2834473.1 hypothetical protein [Nocardioides sp.]